MQNEERKPFYIGVRPCGCITAAMVDDDTISRSDVTAFENDMVRSGRRFERRMLTRAGFDATFRMCPHSQPNA